MTPTQVKEFVDYRDAFMMAFRRLQVENKEFSDPEIDLPELLAVFEKHEKEVLNEKLDVFSRSFTSNEEAIPAFFKELNGRASIKVKNNETSCLLRAMAYSTFFNNEYAEAFGLLLKNQLIDLTFTAGICANVVFDGNAESINSLNKEIVDTVTRISSHTAKWVNESLIASWPSAHNQILKEQIMRNAGKPGYVGKRSLEISAVIVVPILLRTGLPNYSYKLFIAKGVEPEYELYFEGIDNHCSLKKGSFDFDTVIGRIHRGSASQTSRHRSFGLINDYSELKNKIWSEMNTLDDLPTLPLIAEKLKKKIGKKFITENKFHCWAIVREYASILYGPHPAINSWTKYYDVIDSVTIRTLNYTSTTHDGDKFQFVFFA
ncbi:hypothetical protein CRE_30771 [Caenorhabditis remanei]|uniref:Uncharacterized protein n=1 Tax=Caenorhabditis remanei TaxID=31234 RepID=E3LU75_CAERE|nr:hypothetical protein CRE_30771 [Caenorhabditis remanei]